MTQNTGTSKKKKISRKKVNIFCHSFQKVKPKYYIDLLHRVKYFKPLFTLTLLFSHLADAFIQSDLQMRKSY